MNENELYEALTEVARDVFDDDTLVLGPDTTARDVPGWDSQGNVMLIVAVEQRFRVRFRASEFERLLNVGEFISLIMNKIGCR